MKARYEKAWHQLRKQDRAIIEQVKAREAMQIVMHEEAELQKRWLKLFCIVFNKNAKYGKKRLLLALGWWREMYRIVSTFPTNEEFNAYLDSEMDRIFGKGGYPSEYIDKLEDL